MPRPSPPTDPPAAPGRARDFAFSIALLALVFVPMSLLRFIDGDEGYYLLAARLVSEGQTPYADFFYPQMPLLLYPYELWFKVFGPSWYGARTLTALFAIAIGVLVHLSVQKARGSSRAALLAVVLYAASSLVFGWFTVVKTYALSALLLMGAYFVLEHARGIPPRVRLLASGFLFGGAVHTRLFLGAVFPGFLPTLLRRQDKGGIGRVGWFLAGALAALLPNLYYLATAREGFWFGNVGYHLVRSELEPLGALAQKAALALSMIGVYQVEGVVSPQFGILLLLSFCAFAHARITARRVDPALWIGLLICVVSLAPTPTFAQYDCVAVPFLVISAVLWIHEVWSRRSPESMSAPGRLLRWVATFLVVSYVALAPVDLIRYAFYGRDVPGIAGDGDRTNWRIPTVQRVTREIDRLNPERRPVITWWPGYFVESSSRILPGMEDHFGVEVAARMDAGERRRLHLMSESEVLDSLRTGSYEVVVGNWVKDKAARRNALGVAPGSTIDSTTIFAPRLD